MRTMLRGYLLLFFGNFIHKQIFSPFAARFGVMTKQNVIETETQQFLRRQQRHSRLIGRAIAFALVAFYASRHQIVRRTFAALRPRQNMIERQILCVFVLGAILAAVSVANIDPRALHRRFLAATLDVDVRPQTHHRRHGNSRRRRMQNIVAVVFFNR